MDDFNNNDDDEVEVDDDDTTSNMTHKTKAATITKQKTKPARVSKSTNQSMLSNMSYPSMQNDINSNTITSNKHPIKNAQYLQADK